MVGFIFHSLAKVAFGRQRKKFKIKACEILRKLRITQILDFYEDVKIAR